MRIKLLPYILILPVVIYLVIFFVYPIFSVIIQALYDDSGFTLRHFQEVTSHWKFPISLKNVLYLTFTVVPIQLAFSLLMATMVNNMKKGRDTVLYIWTIPLGISDLAAGLVWLAIFEHSGFLNTIMGSLGLIDNPISLLTYNEPGLVFLAIALTEVWRATAIMFVILVSGIGLIPKEYYEAGRVFGASNWKQFIKITLPLLRPSLQTALVLRIILAFEVFAIVEVLGGTLFPVLMSQTFTYQFELLNSPAAAAMALIILVISIAFTLVVLRILKVPKGVKI